MAKRLINKISSKTVMGDLKLMAAHMLVGDVKSRELYTVIGIARKADGKETDYGTATKFVGNFSAVNLQTGEEFRSGAAYLPGAAGDMLYGAMGGDPVEFGFKIGIELDNSAATGYIFTVESLIEPGENDPLVTLARSISAPLAIESVKASDTVIPATHEVVPAITEPKVVKGTAKATK